MACLVYLGSPKTFGLPFIPRKGFKGGVNSHTGGHDTFSCVLMFF